MKIWTCFEHALKTHTHLMRDRHLDQIIMCAIYGVAKINLTGDRTISFQNIIEEYRHQPHATNAVIIIIDNLIEIFLIIFDI